MESLRAAGRSLGDVVSYLAHPAELEEHPDKLGYSVKLAIAWEAGFYDDSSAVPAGAQKRKRDTPERQDATDPGQAPAASGKGSPGGTAAAAEEMRGGGAAAAAKRKHREAAKSENRDRQGEGSGQQPPRQRAKLAEVASLRSSKGGKATGAPQPQPAHTATATATATSAAADAPVYLPFADALKFARTLGLKNQVEWRAYARGTARPSNIPRAPHVVYKGKGWQGDSHWCGAGAHAEPTKPRQVAAPQAKAPPQTTATTVKQAPLCLCRAPHARRHPDRRRACATQCHPCTRAAARSPPRG